MLELPWQQEATDAVGWGFEVNRLLTDACSCVCLLQCMTQEWYRNFVNEGVAESEMAFGLLEAGHYMDIRPLIELMCLRITFVEFADRSWEEVSAESTVEPNHALRVLCSHAFFYSSSRPCLTMKLHHPPQHPPTRKPLQLRRPLSKPAETINLSCVFPTCEMVKGVPSVPACHAFSEHKYPIQILVSTATCLSNSSGLLKWCVSCNHCVTIELA